MTIVSEFIEVLDPIAPRTAAQYHLVPRLSSLSGKTLAVFDDNNPNAKELVEALADILVNRDGVAAIRYRNLGTGAAYDLKDGERKVVPSQTLEEVARCCDGAVLGVAF